MKQVVIIDYGMGNLDSVRRAMEECGGRPVISSQKNVIDQASHIILPGVGSFSDGMSHIRKCGLDIILSEQVLKKGVPFLGICLGMQLMARKGFEGGETEGLGWIDAEVRRLVPNEADQRIPHVGWNEVRHIDETSLFKGLPTTKDFYFVHSFHMVCRDPRDIRATTPYCGNFTSMVSRKNCYGVQFHPEKSQKAGFQLLRNFLEL